MATKFSALEKAEACVETSCGLVEAMRIMREAKRNGLSGDFDDATQAVQVALRAFLNHSLGHLAG